LPDMPMPPPVAVRRPGSSAYRALAAAAFLLVSAPLAAAPPAPAPSKKPSTTAEVLAASTPADWRALDPQNTLYMELPAGRVVIELAPQFAPHHVANVTALAREHYFDGLWIMRAQDNYVVQWGDPDSKKSVGAAQRSLAAEFERPLRGLTLTKLPDADTYAAEVGFLDGFPVAADPASGRAWPVHCYGMVGAGRDNDVDVSPHQVVRETRQPLEVSLGPAIFDDNILALDPPELAQRPEECLEDALYRLAGGGTEIADPEDFRDLLRPGIARRGK